MANYSKRQCLRGTTPGRDISRRDLLRQASALGISLAAMPFVARQALAQAADLDVFTFSVYAVPELTGTYIDRYGDLPSYTMMGSLEEGFNKLAGGYRPDIAMTGYEFIGKWHDAELLQPIDTSRLTQWENVFPKLQESGKLADGQQWAMPFIWGNSSVVYRTDLLPQYVGNDTWKILWDPELAGRIAIRDSAEEAAMPAALIAGVTDPFNMTDEEIATVGDMLREQRELLRFYWSDQTSLMQDIASGEIVAAYATSDVWAQLAAEGVPVAYMAPKEGVLTWMDLAVMVADSEVPEEQRYTYLDALLSPESGAFAIETYAFGHANRKAFEIADAETVQALGMSDPDAVLNSSFLLRPYDPATQQKLNRAFEEIKAGE
jgi:spermidine/putrescine transport system substrate-binding protein